MQYRFLPFFKHYLLQGAMFSKVDRTMPNSAQSVEECDATGLRSSNVVRSIKKYIKCCFH